MMKYLVRLAQLACISSVFFIAASQAQTIINPTQETTYSIKPDYRKCAFPLCGGWFLTPVNQYSLSLETEDEAYQNSLILPNTIYVAYINYKRLGLTEKQIEELKSAIGGSEQALLRGTVTPTLVSSKIVPPSKTLVASGAWVGANKNEAVGTYLKVSSTGIVCITTPCPYFKANIINSTYTSQFHELNFEKAALTPEQEAQAWQTVSSDGLVLTGVKFVSQGQVGTGVGIAATKVFFAFPAKNKSPY